MGIYLDLKKTPFSLDHTLSCGQTFRWRNQGELWTGVVGDTVIEIQQDNGALDFKTSSADVGSNFLWHYFRFEDDLLNVYRKIMKDRHIREAVNRFHGLRLVRQEPWECLISFICATNANIPAIRRMIENLCRRFGKTLKFEGEEFFGFPNSEALAKANQNELKLCGLGYRIKPIQETSRSVSEGNFNLEGLRLVPYETAKKELMKLPGVGPKVADCVLLFSLEKLEAFPIDVWMKRVTLKYYSRYFKPEFVARVGSKKGLSTGEYRVIYDFARAYFGDCLGYAQEYLYHSIRCASG